MTVCTQSLLFLRVEKLLHRSNLLLPSERSFGLLHFDLLIKFLRTRRFAEIFTVFLRLSAYYAFLTVILPYFVSSLQKGSLKSVNLSRLIFLRNVSYSFISKFISLLMRYQVCIFQPRIIFDFMDLLYYSLQSCKWGRLCHQYIIDAQFIREHLCTIMDLRPKQTFNG